MMTIFEYIIMKCDIVKYMPKLIFQFNFDFNSIFNFNFSPQRASHGHCAKIPPSVLHILREIGPKTHERITTKVVLPVSKSVL